MKKTILFDLDGALIDFTDAILSSFQGASKILGLTPKSNEEIRDLISHPLEHMFKILYHEKAHLSQGFILVYCEIYSQIYSGQTTLLPKTEEALELASEIADLGIMTTEGGKFTPLLLGHLRVEKFFKTLIALEDVTNPKPHAEPILLVLEKVQKTRENAYMIDDTILDIQAAVIVDITPLALSCGYGDEDELERYPMVFPNAYKSVLHIRND